MDLRNMESMIMISSDMGEFAGSLRWDHVAGKSTKDATS